MERFLSIFRDQAQALKAAVQFLLIRLAIEVQARAGSLFQERLDSGLSLEGDDGSVEISGVDLGKVGDSIAFDDGTQLGETNSIWEALQKMRAPRWSLRLILHKQPAMQVSLVKPWPERGRALNLRQVLCLILTEEASGR